MKMMITFALAPLAVLFSASLAFANPQLLTAEQWQADLERLDEAIRSGHPRPFRGGKEATYSGLVDTLNKDIAALGDKDIIVRLAEIVALISDGHTRLSIPRQHPEIGLEFGHAGTPLPDIAGLAFRQLPVTFEQFDDGIFIVAASAEHASLIGARLEAIDDTAAGDAMDTVQRITFAENAQLMKLMGADRLSLPEALVTLGIAKRSDGVTLKLTDAIGSTETLSVEPLPAGAITWTGPEFSTDMPLRLENPDLKFWWRYLPEEKTVYAQVNEITDADIKLAQFVARVIAEAEHRGAKLVIDLRSNFGGRGDLNRTFELALIQSRDLNQYGRTFILTGRRTFSAAQMLTNMLEKYTRVLFVGEPTGARPDHYGDARKTRLKNSGLTLRVSSLHWSSQHGNDEREANNPDLPAPWTSQAFFAGRDPALEMVFTSGPHSFKSLTRAAIQRDDHYQIARYMTHAILSPDTHGDDLSKIYLALGKEFVEEGALDFASFAFRYGLYLYPDDADLKAEFAKMKD